MKRRTHVWTHRIRSAIYRGEFEGGFRTILSQCTGREGSNLLFIEATEHEGPCQAQGLQGRGVDLFSMQADEMPAAHGGGHGQGHQAADHALPTHAHTDSELPAFSLHIGLRVCTRLHSVR